MAALKLNKRMSDTIETARVVVSQLDLDKALSIVLKRAMEMTKTVAGSIALYTPKTSTMRIHAYRGFSKYFIADRAWKVRRGGLTAGILKSKSITMINDTTNRSFFTKPGAVREGIKSLICVPLIYSILTTSPGEKSLPPLFSPLRYLDRLPRLPFTTRGGTIT